MGDLFSNMYIIAVVGVVVQYLISGKGNGVAGWVLPVISLAVVTYLQLFVWLPKSHGSDLPIIDRSVNYLAMNTDFLMIESRFVFYLLFAGGTLEMFIQKGYCDVL